MGSVGQITGYNWPQSAAEGQAVQGPTVIQNKYSGTVTFKLRIEYQTAYTATGQTYHEWNDTLAAGQSKTYYPYFIMPASGVWVRAYLYYYTSGGYVQDDSRAFNVTLQQSFVSEFTDLSISSISPNPATIGGNLLVYLNCKYRGPALTTALDLYIRNITWMKIGTVNHTFSESINWTSRTLIISAALGSNITPNNYDVELRIGGASVNTGTGKMLTIQAPYVPPQPEARNLTIESVQSPVDAGDNCIVSVSYEYKGPAATSDLIIDFRNAQWYSFNWVQVGSITRAIAASDAFTKRWVSCIVSTAGLEPKVYDVRARFAGLSTQVTSAVEVVVSNEVTGWHLVDTKVVSTLRTETVEGWYLVDTQIVSLESLEVVSEGWYLVETMNFSILRGEEDDEPSGPGEPSEEDEKSFPVGIVVLGVGGALLTAGIVKKVREKKKS